MSTSPQSGGQRVIYVHLEQEPEVTAEVSVFDISSMSVVELISPSHSGLGFRYWYVALLLTVYLTADLKFYSSGLPLLIYIIKPHTTEQCTCRPRRGLPPRRDARSMQLCI